MTPVDLCQAYLEPGGGFLGHRCGRLATHEVVLEDGRQGRLCDLCWAKVQDQARKHTVRLMQHERFTEPSIVYAPYVPVKQSEGIMAEKTEGRVWRLDPPTACQAFRIKGRGLVVNVPPAVVAVMPGLAVGDLVAWDGDWHRVTGIEHGGGRGGVGLVLAAAEAPPMRPAEVRAAQERMSQLGPEEVGALREALASVRATMACDARDWERDRRDAWVYAIMVGWGVALEAVAAQHGWQDADVVRLRAMRAAIARVQRCRQD